MKSLLFLICLMFSFLSYSFAKPAIPVKEKPKSEISQIAVLSQNEMLFKGIVILQKKKSYIIEDTLFACFYGYLESPKFYQKPSKKPCKIPIPHRTRNKDNI